MKKSIKYLSSQPKETKKIGEKIGREILKNKQRPILLLLTGHLGSGKTTFVQGLAKTLKIKEKITSPSFVIFKSFKIKDKKSGFSFFYHFDLYRIKKMSELKILGFDKIISDKKNIIAIEWGEKIKKYLKKKNFYLISFKVIKPFVHKISILKKP